MAREQHRRTLIAALLLAVSYYLGVHAGFALTSEHAPVALLWPPNALLLAALLLSPKRAWPVLIAAALPAHVLAEMSAQVPLSMVLCWFVSNVAEALIGACFIRGVLHRPPQFEHFRDLVVFLIGAPLLGAFVSSFLDAGFVAAIGWRYSDFWTVWRSRLLSNVLATLALVPLVINLAQSGGRLWRRPAVLHIVETAVLLLGLWVTCALVFLKTQPGPDDLMHLYMPLPFLIWAAMRLSVSGVSLCVASVAAFAMSGMLQGRGPFSSGEPLADVMALQVFLIIAAVSVLLQCVSLSELRNARQIAIQRGERLQLALGAARMGIWSWEVGSQQLTWSSSSYDLAGQELQSETTMTRLVERIHPDDRTNVSAAFARVANGAEHLDVEFRWSGAGEPGWAAAIGKVWQGDGTRRVLGVHMNVSERKQQELQMHQQREQLLHLSRVAMLGELSGALAHELSQPMTAILANAQAAHRSLQHGADFEVREIIEDIVAENKRAAAVIRRLRALFVRGASDAEPVDINECVRDVLSLSHSDLVARNIAVEVQLAPNLPSVRADRIQLQQVLLNLILNACDAMSDNNPGERSLSIVTQLTEQGEVGIEVCDRGSGIDDVERVFEPFFTTKQHGLGLGLAICHTIVSTHRGRLWATNNPDRGATMHIVLPVAGPSERRRRSIPG
jgi:two-component system sensor kinase FixL